MVLQGDVMLQEDESKPVEGLTVTETSAAPAPRRHNAQNRLTLRSDDATLGRFFLDDAWMLNFIPAGHRRTDMNANATATNRQMKESRSKRWVLMEVLMNALKPWLFV